MIAFFIQFIYHLTNRLDYSFNIRKDFIIIIPNHSKARIILDLIISPIMGDTGGLINVLIAVLTFKTKGSRTSLLFNPHLNLPHNGEED